MTKYIYSSLFAVGLLILPNSKGEETYDPTRLTPTTLLRGLNRPMELEVADDGRVFYIEIDGHLRILKPGSGESILAGSLRVYTGQENGLIGIALDPDFANNQWIYLQYSPPDYNGQHVSRFTMKGDSLDLESEKILLQFTEQRLQCCHHAGSMEFAPDGCLFISTGDNTHPGGDSKGFAPIDERPDRMPWDAQKSASNKFSYNGKVLRIRPLPDGTCEIPDGNLFPKDGSEGLPEIYTMGCRNPWRISVDSKTGTLYWGDVGPDAGGPGDRGPAGHDEINQAKAPGNFGWPYFVGPNLAYPDVDFETGEIGITQDPNAPVNESPNSKGHQVLPPVQPAFVYYHRNETKDFPMLETGGRTACAGPVFHFDKKLESDTQFHPHFDNSLFIYEWSRHWIFAVHLDENENIKEVERFMPEYSFVRPIDMDFGTDGSLYMIEYGETWGKNDDCQLIRIDYIRGNRPPSVKVTARGNAGKAPLKVELDTTGTRDPDDGDTLTYEWKVIPGDNVVSTEPNPTLDFDTMGNYQVALTVSDNHGAKHTSSIPVSVGNAAPKIAFSSPQDGDFFTFGEPIDWKLNVSDEEDGSIPEDRIKIYHQAVRGKFAETSPVLSGSETLHPGLELMKQSDCFNCHRVDQKLVGPALIEIAQKYDGDSEALDRSAHRILAGSSGVWGPIPMMPHPQHGIEQARSMATWILSLNKEDSNVLTGSTGSFAPARPKTISEKDAAVLLIEATYLDGGVPPIPPLSASKTIRLRPSRLEAEQADEVHNCKVAGGKIGSVAHGGHLKFENINLSGIKKLRVNVASGGPGGLIEFRLGSLDSSVLATAKVEPKGDWSKHFNIDADLAATDARGDLYISFRNEGVGNGICNLDWVEFLKK